MKREGKVWQQYKQVKYRVRKKLLDKSMREEPGNCCFHVPVSVEKTSGVVLCAYKEMTGDVDWDVVVCDTEQAKRCTRFTTEATPEEIKSRFERFLSFAETSGNAQAIGTLAYHYPDLAALLWVLEPWACKGLSGGCDAIDYVDSNDSGTSSISLVSGGGVLLGIKESEGILVPEKASESFVVPLTEEYISSVHTTEDYPSSVTPDKIEEDESTEHPVVTSVAALRKQGSLSLGWIPMTGVAVTVALFFFLLLYWSLSG